MFLNYDPQLIFERSMENKKLGELVEDEIGECDDCNEINASIGQVQRKMNLYQTGIFADHFNTSSVARSKKQLDWDII